ARWSERPDAGLSIFPCELVTNNGDTLHELVLGLARHWAAPEPFVEYLSRRCVWVNSLVDRIVSAPLDPVGAIAEPYALWAIERQPGIDMPCTHEAIVLTDDLRRYEQLKLFFLNLGHTWLADQWLQEHRGPNETVLDMMNDARLRDGIETVWHEEVLPVFTAMDCGSQADRYIDSVRERFLNPWLDHRIADIAQNHVAKVERRIAPLIDLANSLPLPQPISQPRLHSMLARHGIAPAVQGAQ